MRAKLNQKKGEKMAKLIASFPESTQAQDDDYLIISRELDTKDYKIKYKNMSAQFLLDAKPKLDKIEQDLKDLEKKYVDSKYATLID